MGWDAPKPDPKLVAAQTAEAQRASQDRIALIQQQLGSEDQVRSQVYGQQPAGTGGGSGGTDYGGGGGGGLSGRFF